MKRLKSVNNWLVLVAFVACVVYFSMLKHDWKVPAMISNITKTYKSSAVMIPFEGKHMINLPEKVVSGVRLFVLFVGYPRSGHSIIASLLDAHPNVIVANQFNVFQWMDNAHLNFSKSHLFNELFNNSYNRPGARSKNRKGYNLTVDNSWQGRYRDRIDVIGDKNGGSTANLYNKKPEFFRQKYEKLLQVISIPINFIHCVRNPYDIISTGVLYRSSGSKQVQFSRLQNGTIVQSEIYKNDQLLANQIKQQFRFADSVLDSSRSLIKRHSILEVHNHELVSYPKQTILKLCQFLEIECSRDYVKSCASKVFPELSRTRFTVDWPEEAKKMVQENIQNYPFFRNYSYESSN